MTTSGVLLPIASAAVAKVFSPPSSISSTTGTCTPEKHQRSEKILCSLKKLELSVDDIEGLKLSITRVVSEQFRFLGLDQRALLPERDSLHNSAKQLGVLGHSNPC